MASIRINATLRDEIISQLLKHRFGEERKAVDELGDSVRKKLLDEVKEMSGNRKLLETIPRNWLPSTGHISVGGDGHYFVVNLTKGNTPNVAVPNFARSSVHWSKVSKELQDMLLKLESDLADLKSRETEAKETALAAIRSVTTVGALVNLWPEVEEIVGKAVISCGMSNRNLPSIPTGQLNTLFKLP